MGEVREQHPEAVLPLRHPMRDEQEVVGAAARTCRVGLKGAEPEEAHDHVHRHDDDEDDHEAAFTVARYRRRLVCSASSSPASWMSSVARLSRVATNVPRASGDAVAVSICAASTVIGWQTVIFRTRFGRKAGQTSTSRADPHDLGDAHLQRAAPPRDPGHGDDDRRIDGPAVPSTAAPGPRANVSAGPATNSTTKAHTARPRAKDNAARTRDTRSSIAVSDRPSVHAVPHGATKMPR